MEMELYIYQMARNTKEIGKIENNMVEVLLPGLMEGSIQVYSGTVNHTGKEHT